MAEGGAPLGRPILRDYGFAVGATLFATLATLAVTHWLADFPLLILLTAVMASALRGGAGPGFAATGLSGLALVGATHFLAAEFRIPRINIGAELVRAIVFVFVAGAISVLAGARRHAEEQRYALMRDEKASRERAEAASRAKDVLLATVSHELRNPLAAILSWSSLFRDAPLDERAVRRAFEAIERNAQAQSRLIEDLLDVSRIVTGKLRMDARAMNLVPVIEAALDAVSAAAEAKHIAVERVLDPKAGAVRGDPERLQQVVWNLLSNAVKFTPAGGQVRITLGRFNDQAELRVVDTGEGIDPAVMPRLFEPFWQAETRTDRHAGGLGLGLAIVRHVVELHGGTVVAHSRGPGTGALLRVTIPLMESDERAERAA